MNSNSQYKVLKSGFKIIRKDDYPQPRIKYLDPESKSWKTLEKFNTKASRDREFDIMLKNSKTIED